MHSPEVSIIIPAYNTGAYIQQAIDSALNQTLSNIEVIVVDDASADDTVAIVRQIQDNRLKLLINSQNVGVSAARNRALMEARGTWIAVLDSDDWYDPNRLERLLQVAGMENADIVADDLYLIRDGESCPWTTQLQQGKAAFTSVQRINPVYFVETDRYGKEGLHLGFSKPLFRRRFLDEHQIRYDPQLRCSEDFWFTFTCLVRGARFFLVPEPYYYYRARPNSLIRQRPLARLEKELMAIDCFLHEPIVKAQPALHQALRTNAEILTLYRNYYRVVEPLKQQHLWTATIAIIQHPSVLLRFISQIPAFLYRRFRKTFLGKELWEGLS